MAEEITAEQLRRLLEMAGKRLGTDPETLRQTLESGQTERLFRNAGEQNPTLRQALTNPDRAAKLLESPGLRAMLNKLLEG